MKANIKKQSVKENKIVLSIGMIVKNEEKHLDNCLSALQKLRDNVSSELIIVDTGSTDRTKEIALKYTDKVYDFEWINDFSAARNHGLEKAVGEWFMFIDADEYLDENCEEMIKFFNMPELSKKYNSASFIIKNYGGRSRKDSSQFLAPRIVRNSEGIRFNDPIHEWLPQLPPHGFFGTVFHHYGYDYSSKKERDKKSKRNIEPILREYEKSPNSLRILYHLCACIYEDEYFETAEKKEKYLNEYLSEAKKRITEPYALVAYKEYACYYMNYNRHREAVDLFCELVNIDFAKESVLIVMAYYYLVLSYLKLEDYEKAYESIEKYFYYYQKYKDNKLSFVELRFGLVIGISEYDFEEMSICAIKCLSELERYDEAVEYLNKIEFSEISFLHLELYMKELKNFIGKSHRYDSAFSCYERILECNDTDKTEMALSLLEQYYMEHPLEREDFINEAVRLCKKGKYSELANIIKDDMEGKKSNERLSDFLNSAERWNEGYSEAIYLAVKHKVDITPAIEKMDYSVIRNIITAVSDGHEYDYSEAVLDYCIDFDYSAGIKQMFWCVSALEAAVLKSNELPEDRQPELFDLFVSILSDYVSNIYNPDLLNPEDADVLPELHRFGYFITVAFNAKNNGDLISYVRNMKEALRLCESMKNVVAFYLSELEEEMKQ